MQHGEESDDYIETTSSSSEDDQDAELLTEELEQGFLKVLSQLKRKHPKLYDESITYFPKEDSEYLTSGSCSKKSQLERYKKWLKGQINEVGDDDVKKDLEALHDIWADPNIKQEDQFLRDYILNKKFLDPDENFSVEKELEKLIEEEKEVEEQTVFEQKYNCRFESPDQEFLKKYPNTMKKAYGKKKNTFIVESVKESTKNSPEKILEHQQNKTKSKNSEVEKQKVNKKLQNQKRESSSLFTETIVKDKAHNIKQNVGIKRKSEDFIRTTEKKIKQKSKSEPNNGHASNKFESISKVKSMNTNLEVKNEGGTTDKEEELLVNEMRRDLKQKPRKPRKRRSLKKSSDTIYFSGGAIKGKEVNVTASGNVSPSNTNLENIKPAPITKQELKIKQEKVKERKAQYFEKSKRIQIKKRNLKKLKGIKIKKKSILKQNKVNMKNKTKKLGRKPRHRSSLKASLTVVG